METSGLWTSSHVAQTISTAHYTEIQILQQNICNLDINTWRFAVFFVSFSSSALPHIPPLHAALIFNNQLKDFQRDITAVLKQTEWEHYAYLHCGKAFSCALLRRRIDYILGKNYENYASKLNGLSWSSRVWGQGLGPKIADWRPNTAIDFSWFSSVPPFKCWVT